MSFNKDLSSLLTPPAFKGQAKALLVYKTKHTTRRIELQQILVPKRVSLQQKGLQYSSTIFILTNSLNPLSSSQQNNTCMYIQDNY